LLEARIDTGDYTAERERDAVDDEPAADSAAAAAVAVDSHLPQRRIAEWKLFHVRVVARRHLGARTHDLEARIHQVVAVNMHAQLAGSVLHGQLRICLGEDLGDSLLDGFPRTFALEIDKIS